MNSRTDMMKDAIQEIWTSKMMYYEEMDFGQRYPDGKEGLDFEFFKKLIKEHVLFSLIVLLFEGDNDSIEDWLIAYHKELIENSEVVQDEEK